ncbi:MAG: V-type ATPase subunit [archaeon]|nr:V-type ATPase subunit [archaeon]
MTIQTHTGYLPKTAAKTVSNLSAIFRKTLAYRSVRYGYANSRTKAMRATLLTKKEIESLIEAKNIQEIVGLLSKTAYSHDIMEEAVSFSRADLVELSLTKNFSRTLKKLVKIAPKSDSEKISRVFERYDVLNIKNLLLGIHLREPKEKIKLLLIESPGFSRASLNSLAESPGVKELVEKLKNSDYYSVLAQKVSEYEKNQEIENLVSALESRYHKKAAEANRVSADIGKTVKSMLDAETDAKNIMTILRGKKEGFDAKKISGMLIEGGKLSRSELEKIGSANFVEEAVKLQKAFDLSGALEDYKKSPSLTHFENALEQSISAKGLAELRRSILSLSAIVGFLFLKEKEISDVRKIVRTKEFGFSPEEIRKIVVVT